MTMGDVDAALADWAARLRRIDDNLVALETNPVCTLLERAAPDGLDGATRATVAPALAAMRELFAQRSLLDDALGKASEMRKGLNRMFPGDTLKEIERILRGPSIALPPVETPLARRGLLDAAETTTSISPDQLLSAMVTSFQQARDAVMAVDEAWARLTTQADRAAADADRLAARADSLAEDIHAPLTAVRAQLDAARSRIARDPLGAAAAMAGEVSRRLDDLGAELSALEARRAAVGSDLDRAHRLMAQIGDTRTWAAEARRRHQIEIAPEPADPPLPADVDLGRVEGLSRWLATIDATLAAGRWAAAGVGADRWLEAARALLDEQEAVRRACAAALDRRDELLGRVRARRQQARTLAARGHPIDPGVDAAGARAEQALCAPQVLVTRAAELVAAYEAALRSSIG